MEKSTQDMRQEWRSKGGRTTVERYGPEFLRQIARKGGQTTLERHGRSHFSKMGKIGYRKGIGKGDAKNERRG